MARPDLLSPCPSCGEGLFWVHSPLWETEKWFLSGKKRRGSARKNWPIRCLCGYAYINGRVDPTYSKEEIARIKVLYEGGWTRAEIAQELLMAESTVARYMKQLGVKPRKRGQTNKSGYRSMLPPGGLYELKRLYAMGYSSTEVGKMMGIAGSTVIFNLKRAGVPRRTPAETIMLQSRRNQQAKRSTTVIDMKERNKKSGPTLPIEPFRAWIRELVANGTCSQAELAAQWGFPDRRLHAWLNDTKEISFDTVDRIALLMDVSMEDIYPDLDKLVSLAA